MEEKTKDMLRTNCQAIYRGGPEEVSFFLQVALTKHLRVYKSLPQPFSQRELLAGTPADVPTTEPAGKLKLPPNQPTVSQPGVAGLPA